MKDYFSAAILLATKPSVTNNLNPPISLQTVSPSICLCYIENPKEFSKQLLISSWTCHSQEMSGQKKKSEPLFQTSLCLSHWKKWWSHHIRLEPKKVLGSLAFLNNFFLHQLIQFLLQCSIRSVGNGTRSFLCEDNHQLLVSRHSASTDSLLLRSIFQINASPEAANDPAKSRSHAHFALAKFVEGLFVMFLGSN